MGDNELSVGKREKKKIIQLARGKVLNEQTNQSFSPRAKLKTKTKKMKKKNFLNDSI